MGRGQTNSLKSDFDLQKDVHPLIITLSCSAFMRHMKAEVCADSTCVRHENRMKSVLLFG